MKHKKHFSNLTFNISEKIGSGCFGDVYAGRCLQTGEEVAIKKEYIGVHSPQLFSEMKIVRLLNGSIGFPSFFGYWPDDGFNALAETLLGKNLIQLFRSCNHRFSMKTVLMLAEQMINRLEFLHSKDIIHRDIKPENFLIGKGKNQNVIYLADFGLSKFYRDPISHIHIPFREGRPLVGTARYISLNIHNGIEPSRRDDLESLAYLLIYFAKGKLPWQGFNSNDKVAKRLYIFEKKQSTPINSLCEGLPSEFSIFLESVRKLGFEETPHYTNYKNLFRSVLLKMGETYDYKFCWLPSESDPIAETRLANKENEISLQNSSKLASNRSQLISPPHLHCLMAENHYLMHNRIFPRSMDRSNFNHRIVTTSNRSNNSNISIIPSSCNTDTNILKRNSNPKINSICQGEHANSIINFKSSNKATNNKPNDIHHHANSTFVRKSCSTFNNNSPLFAITSKEDNSNNNSVNLKISSNNTNNFKSTNTNSNETNRFISKSCSDFNNSNVLFIIDDNKDSNSKNSIKNTTTDNNNTNVGNYSSNNNISTSTNNNKKENNSACIRKSNSTYDSRNLFFIIDSSSNKNNININNNNNNISISISSSNSNFSFNNSINDNDSPKSNFSTSTNPSRATNCISNIANDSHEAISEVKVSNISSIRKCCSDFSEFSGFQINKSSSDFNENDLHINNPSSDFSVIKFSTSNTSAANICKSKPVFSTKDHNNQINNRSSNTDNCSGNNNTNDEIDINSYLNPGSVSKMQHRASLSESLFSRYNRKINSPVVIQKGAPTLVKPVVSRNINNPEESSPINSSSVDDSLKHQKIDDICQQKTQQQNVLHQIEAQQIKNQQNNHPSQIQQIYESQHQVQEQLQLNQVGQQKLINKHENKKQSHSHHNHHHYHHNSGDDCLQQFEMMHVKKPHPLTLWSPNVVLLSKHLV